VEHAGKGLTQQAECSCLIFYCLLANIVVALSTVIVGGGGHLLFSELVFFNNA